MVLGLSSPRVWTSTSFGVNTLHPQRTGHVKMKTARVVCIASLFVAFPLIAQSGGRDGHGHGNHGNSSSHSGHDNDGKSAGHRQDRPHGFGDHDLVLGSQAQAS